MASRSGAPVARASRTLARRSLPRDAEENSDMCGIVGYTGPREAGPILIEGLQRLEYRGYDSAGIALVDEEGDLFVEKKAGKLANLQTALADRTPHAAIGLAHTRWATHGRPNDLNAHPHQDCTGDITVIHNGIIENFRELRDGLEARGHTLTSETDTEAIAHLVEEAYQGDLADAVRAALRQLEGAYALVVMHKGEISRLVGARQDVPLVVGLHGEESFIASDVAAILAHTEPDHLPRGGRRRRRPADRRRRSPTSTARPRAGRDDRRLDARGRREGRLRPLHAQGDPRAARGAPPVHRRPGDPRRPDPARGDRPASRTRSGASTRIELVACGSAYYAALVGAAALEEWTGLPARATVGSEFRYSPPPLDAKTLVIAVTQSGETADTIAPTRHAREQGCPIVAVTNTVGSAITREADAVVFLQAGPGDRGRRVEDLHDPGHDARDPRGGDRQDPRDADRRRRSASSADALHALPAAAQRALDDAAAARPRSPAATSTRAASCSSAAATRYRPRSRAR